MEKIDNDLTVTISVYKNDKPEFFELAVNSVLNQTLKAKELIITVDGPIGKDLEDVVSKYEKQENIIVSRSEVNQGLALAHAKAVDLCKTSYLAIMDGDDISVLNRFEKQMKFLHEHPDVDCIGSQIKEFISETGTIAGIRRVPLDDSEIKKYMKRRCPMNHMTVIMKKDKVLEAGNYQPWHLDEDSFLWCRMALVNAKFANLDENLVNVRVGADMYRRRGGWKYFKSEARLMKWMWKHKITGFPLYVYNVLIRFALYLAPNWLRGFMFRLVCRSKH